MRKYRFIASLLCAMLLLTVFSGTLVVSADTTEKSVFKVGMECGYAPFNWTQFDDLNGAVPIDGTPGQFANGYDVQIAKRIAEHMGRELAIVKVSWDGLIPALESGKIDAIAAGMSATDERKLAINFSDNYYYSQMVVVVKKDGPFAGATKLDDLAEARLTGQLGTLHYDLIDQVDGAIKETALEDFPSMIIALKSGVIDGYLSEKPGAISAAKANSSFTFLEFPVGEGFIFDDAEISIGVGLRKSDPIVNEINEALTYITQEEREEIMDNVISVQPEEGGGSFFDSTVRIITKYWPQFLKGAATTLFIASIGTIIGLVIGILVASFRHTPPRKGGIVSKILYKILDILLAIYVEVFRGTPMMVQSMIFFYGITYLFGINISPIVAGLIILSINTGAYMSEVVRGGIDSVPSGQFEGAKAIGMTHSQIMTSVILPQAIRNILPATGNEFVINIKDTSVLNVIMVTELFFTTKSVNSNTAAVFETYLISAAIYLVLTFTVTRILRAVEKKMDGPDSYMLTSSSMPATVKIHQEQGGGRA